HDHQQCRGPEVPADPIRDGAAVQTGSRRGQVGSHPMLSSMSGDRRDGAMRSRPAQRRVMSSRRLAALVVLIVLVSAPAFAQLDLGAPWARRSNQDDMESGPGPDPVDYLGLPLNDEGRARALSFQYSAVSLPEHQCGYLSPFYIVLGPFGLVVDRVLD